MAVGGLGVVVEVVETPRVEVSITGDQTPRADGEGDDLFDALATARRQLEADDIMLVCNSARKDVYSSQMLRQAMSGRQAYVLSLPRTAGHRP